MKPEVSDVLVIPVAGVFDQPAAERVQAALDQGAPHRRMRVDLSHVREFHDHALALLASSVARVGASRVALRGLRQHQVRMLRYFGVDAAPDDRRAAELG